MNKKVISIEEVSDVETYYIDGLKDGDSIFANDVLGYTSYNGGHIPRHARIYRDFKNEYEKLQVERVKAFKEFHEDTVNKNFNDPKITVGIDEKEFDDFLKLAERY